MVHINSLKYVVKKKTLVYNFKVSNLFKCHCFMFLVIMETVADWLLHHTHAHRKYIETNLNY